MTYELAKQLKDAGFPQPFKDSKGIAHGEWGYPGEPYAPGMEDKGLYIPTLEELIEECGQQMRSLEQHIMSNSTIEWSASMRGFYNAQSGSTPIEAVARLWLALNKKE